MATTVIQCVADSFFPRFFHTDAWYGDSSPYLGGRVFKWVINSQSMIVWSLGRGISANGSLACARTLLVEGDRKTKVKSDMAVSGLSRTFPIIHDVLAAVCSFEKLLDLLSP